MNPCALCKDISVNYIWMSKNRHTTLIPEKEMALFQYNAEKYRNIKFNLWTECTKAYKCYDIPDNVTLRALEELKFYPEYDKALNCELFTIKHDLIRLMVLRAELNNAPKDFVSVYADFDIPDLNLCSAEFSNRIAQHGIIFAGSYCPLRIEVSTYTIGVMRRKIVYSHSLEEGELAMAIGEDGSPVLTNTTVGRGAVCRVVCKEFGKVLTSDFEIGFIAIRQNYIDLLSAFVKQSIVDIETVHFTEDSVYFSMLSTLNRDCSSARITSNWRKNLAGYYVQYCSGWKLEYNPALVARHKNFLRGMLRKQIELAYQITSKRP